MTELAPLDWVEILKNIQGFATSGSGKLSIQALKSMSSPDQAMQSVQEIFNAAELLQTGTRPFMEALDLFEPWHLRVKKNAVLKNPLK